jgi:hypothetical protein
MRQKLSLQNIMVQFRQRWSNLPDTRMPNNNTKYAIVDGVLAAFAVFFMQSSSFLAHQRLLQSKKGRNNARSLFQVEELPSDQQIRNLIDPLSAEHFQTDFLLPDKLRISMRKVDKRNRDRQTEIQEIFKNAKSQLKEAQITAIGSMNQLVQFLLERPKSEIDDPEITQTSSQH